MHQLKRLIPIILVICLFGCQSSDSKKNLISGLHQCELKDSVLIEITKSFIETVNESFGDEYVPTINIRHTNNSTNLRMSQVVNFSSFLEFRPDCYIIVDNKPVFIYSKNSALFVGSKSTYNEMKIIAQENLFIDLDSLAEHRYIPSVTYSPLVWEVTITEGKYEVRYNN